MKITFYSNYLNHHQLPFCLEMYKLLEGNFTFVACDRVSEERLKLGYEDMDRKYPFVLTVYDDAQNMKRAEELIGESDITIHGSDLPVFQKLRRNTKRPLFIYSERLFKPDDIAQNKLKAFLAPFIHLLLRRKTDTYMLCSSNYTAHDYSALGAYRGRFYKWGYFPQSHRYQIDELLKRKADHPRTIILWAARMIGWKHPEYAVETMRYLAQKRIDCEMKIIGDGPLREQVEKQIAEYGLQNRITLTGAVSPVEVRKNMEEASVFLFTSDYNEGWGAVMNESMNSGCAVVASHAIGSAGFLIRNGESGIIYPHNDISELFYWTEQLLINRTFRESMGRKAYQTITDTWNAECAADRLLKICGSLLKRESPDLYQEGPCSKAERFSNQKYEHIVRGELTKLRESHESMKT